MPISVSSDFMSSFDEFSGELWLSIDHLSEDKEGRLDLVGLEGVKYEGSRDRVRSIVEG
jgi:hypothetical protein